MTNRCKKGVILLFLYRFTRRYSPMAIKSRMCPFFRSIREELSDEAISKRLILNPEIAALRSQ